MSNAERLGEALGEVFSEPVVEVDEDLIDRMSAAAATIAEEGFVTRMISVGGVAQAFAGRDGMRRGLHDWFETFSEMRFEPEDAREIGENVVTHARQVGVTRHGGVEIEQPSSVVWKFRDGRIHEIEWHLDRAAAERSARDEP